MWENRWHARQWNNQHRQCVHRWWPSSLYWSIMQLSNVDTKSLRAMVQFALCSLNDCRVCCACEVRSSCLKPLTKRSCRRWGRLLLINKAFEYNRHPSRNDSTALIINVYISLALPSLSLSLSLPLSLSPSLSLSIYISLSLSSLVPFGRTASMYVCMHDNWSR